ncbi:MAG TPA: ShlB/FhaC/HecB family hemolysin secretion/activation protein [Chroococcidiopsis sp.]
MNLRSLVLWCGVAFPGGLLGMSQAYAASAPELPSESFNGGDRLHKQQPQTSSESFDLKDYTQLLLAQSALPISRPAESAPLLAQSPPPLERPERDDPFLQPLPTPQPVSPQEQAPIVPSITAPSVDVPAPTPLPTDNTTRIPVQRIEVLGSTIFSDSDFADIVQPVIDGQTATLEDLQRVADGITQLYLDGGYITSRAVLVDQVIENGVVQIRVVEGALETIEVQGNRRVNTDYIRSRIALGGRAPLNQGRLEDQLRLLRLDPLFDNVEASLRAGTGLGQSILTVRVTEANPFFGEASIDNYSPPSVGSERLGIGLGYRNPTGIGDELFASYYHSTTSGSDVFDFSYRAPVNPMNGTIQLRVAPSSYRITDPAVAAFDIEGNADVYEVSFRQPLVRSPREELALSVGFTYRDGETLISGVQIDSSTTSVVRFGQDYIRRDPTGAWAVRSQFNLGTGLFDATTDGEPDGQFFSWLGQVQRVQILNPDNLLIVQADLQLTPDPLLSSQQFVIGGGQSIRGFRQNARLGDNGFRLSVEDRFTLARNESGIPTVQLAPFAEMGSVWNDSKNPNDLADQNFLAGIGLGLLWNPTPNLNIRLDYALPLVDLSDRGDNAQDEAFYFSIGYRL